MAVVVAPRVFIGSSSEGRSVAEAFQALIADDSEPTIWHQGVFGAGEYTMDALQRAAEESDFAVLVMTPDDVVERRGEAFPAMRDNVLLELGLFMGVLGLNRVLMLAPTTPRMAWPSDLAGITRLPSYPPDRSDRNLRAALGPAALEAKQIFGRRGSRPATSPASAPQAGDHVRLLEYELDLLWTAVAAQGWRRLRPNSTTTIRVISPRGRRFSMQLSADPSVTRSTLRNFARQLRANGLRVNDRVRQPV